MLWNQSAGAFVRYQTSATQVTITSVNDIDDQYGAFAEIGVRADGADVGVAELTSEGEHATVVNLPAGDNKIVDIIAGLKSKPNALLGTYIKGVSFNASATKLSPTRTPKLLVYGDSITVGGSAGNPSLEGWVQLVRNAYAGGVFCEAWGNRALYDDTSTDALRSAFVAWIAAVNPVIIWLAIGTNDYGINKQSAADFGTAYAALLNDLHTALPGATIYAQTPIVRSSEAANSFGDTLGDYRTQIATAQSTRSAYCTLVDGTAILTTGDLADGVHPTTAGHAIYAASVKTTLGI